MLKFKSFILTLGQLTIIPAVVLIAFIDSKLYLILAAVLLSFLFGVVGWNLAQHRYFTHKQFKVKRSVEQLLSVVAVLGTWQSPIEWSAIHHKHHKYADSEDDIHSPIYLGWKNWFFFFHRADKFDMNMSVGRLAVDKWHIAILKLKYSIIIFYASLTYIFLGIEGITYLWLIPTSYSFLSQMIIVNNHSKEGAQNSLIADIITFGEGNHKEHHNNPKSYEDSTLLKPLIKILENA